mgnify:FL=1|jgi:hypothetical protein
MLTFVTCKVGSIPIKSNELYISKKENVVIYRPKKSSLIHMAFNIDGSSSNYEYYPIKNLVYKIDLRNNDCSRQIHINSAKSICVVDSFDSEDFNRNLGMLKMKSSSAENQLRLNVLFLKDTVILHNGYNQEINSKKYAVKIFAEENLVLEEIIYSSGDKSSITLGNCLFHERSEKKFLSGSLEYFVALDDYDRLSSSYRFLLNLNTPESPKNNLLLK